MEVKAVFWLLGAWFGVIIANDVPFYFVLDGELVLRPTSLETITNILWKHKGNLLAEWVKDAEELTFYGSFDGRTSLNITTGHLTITKMRATDVGVYSVEINSKVQDQRYDAKMIRVVSKPKVWIRPLACTADLEMCTLSCEGNTTMAEPITYSWRMGLEEEWKQGEMDLDFTKVETEHVDTFFCKMKNPVSEEESEPVKNPFFEEPGTDSSDLGAGGIAGIIITVLLSLVCLLGFLVYKKKPELITNLLPHTGGIKVTSSVHQPESRSSSPNMRLLENTNMSPDASGSLQPVAISVEKADTPRSPQPAEDTVEKGDTPGSPQPAEDTVEKGDTPGSPQPAEDTVEKGVTPGSSQPPEDSVATEDVPGSPQPAADS